MIGLTMKCYLDSKYNQCCCNCIFQLDLAHWKTSKDVGYVCLMPYEIHKERTVYFDTEEHGIGCEYYSEKDDK